MRTIARWKDNFMNFNKVLHHQHTPSSPLVAVRPTHPYTVVPPPPATLGPWRCGVPRREVSYTSHFISHGYLLAVVAAPSSLEVKALALLSTATTLPTTSAGSWLLHASSALTSRPFGAPPHRRPRLPSFFWPWPLSSLATATPFFLSVAVPSSSPRAPSPIGAAADLWTDLEEYLAPLSGFW
jgi:hypothetical protein